jgi:hypothetical protein
MSDETIERIVAINRGLERSDRAAPVRGESGTTRTAASTCRTSSTARGNRSTHRLVDDGDTWTYHGDSTRATAEFSDDNTLQTVLHERSDDGSRFVPSMRMTLVKVA